MKNQFLSIEELYDRFLVTTGVSIDTRTIQQDQLFFALKGEHFNGNEYADQALQNGALYAVVDEVEYATSDQHILVENSLASLQNLAKFHRSTLVIPIIGLTGSNGKTTTKELIAAVLSTTYLCYATKGNLNNHIGVPLSILEITPKHDIAVIEMGANHMGEIHELCTIAQPNFGLITNIGIAHIEGFGSKENVAKAKGELYEYLKTTDSHTIFLNEDDNQLVQMSHGLETINYGLQSDFVSGEIVSNNPFLTLTIEDFEQEFTITTKLTGEYNFYNSLAAAAVGRTFDVDLLDVVEAIEQYVPKNNRSQIAKSKDNTFIIDAYNANPSSMRVALESFAKVEANNKLVILGSMLELGALEAQEHENIAALAQANFNHILLVGKEFKPAAKQLVIDWVDNTDEAKSWLNKQDFHDFMILLKASRGIQLESLVDLE